MNHKHDPALGLLYATVQDRHTKSMHSVAWWRLLGLPAVLALNGFIMSGGNADLFSIDERFQFFLYCIPLWVLMHAAFIASFEPLLQYQTAAVLQRMSAGRFRPSGRELAKRGSMFAYGLLIAYLYGTDAGDNKRSAPPALVGAVTEYYQACGQAKLLPYSRGLALVEFMTLVCMSAGMAVVVALALTGRSKGGEGFSGTGLISAQAFGVAIYIAATCTKLRELALLQALATVLSERRA